MKGLDVVYKILVGWSPTNVRCWLGIQSLQPHGSIRINTQLTEKWFIRTTDLAVCSTESVVPPSILIFVRKIINSQDF